MSDRARGVDFFARMRVVDDDVFLVLMWVWMIVIVCINIVLFVFGVEFV